MKAWRYDRYGGPEQLALAEMADPVAAAGDLLVRVAATALNAADWHLMRGDPFLVRAVTGFGSGPRRPAVIGSDISGTVVAVGDDVTGFAVGDHVHAEVDTGGAAELIAVKARAAALAPPSLDLVSAAAVGMAAITALHAVREGGRVAAGQRVVVNGASGGVGSFATQLAVAAGAEVTAVASARNGDLVRGLGAHHVLAYDRDDLTARIQDADVFIDIVGALRLRELRARVHRRGRIVLVGGEGGRFLGPAARMLGAALQDPVVPQKLHAVMDSRPSGDDLRTIDAHIAAGRVRPLIDRVCAFDETPDAVRHLETRRARGKILIRVGDAA